MADRLMFHGSPLFRATGWHCQRCNNNICTSDEDGKETKQITITGRERLIRTRLIRSST